MPHASQPPSLFFHSRLDVHLLTHKTLRAVGWVERPFIRWVSLSFGALNSLGDTKKNNSPQKGAKNAKKSFFEESEFNLAINFQ